MNKAVLYAATNAIPRKCVALYLSRFVDNMAWNVEDLVLDIGCGDGGVTKELLLSSLPRFGRIVGIDRSPEMVNFAREHNKHPKLEFHKMDITHDLKEIKTFPSRYNKIFSFFCLHWAQDQRYVLNNIYELLHDEGDAAVIFLTNCPIFKSYVRMQNTDWKIYMTDYKEFISPYLGLEKPHVKFQQLAEEIGFHIVTCEDQVFTHCFSSEESYKNCLKAVVPFMDRIPPEQQNGFLTELMESIVEMSSKKLGEEFPLRTNVLVAHISKRPKV